MGSNPIGPTTSCEHCWHPYMEHSDNFTGRGDTTERCCWCGISRFRRWRLERDARHGTYLSPSVRVYEE